MTFARPDRERRETPLVVEGGGGDLYAVLHEPEGRAQGAVLVVPADGEERFWSHRTVVQAARRLADCGYLALRFDFGGQGESDGDYDAQTVSSRVQDVRSALGLLDRRAGPAAIGLLGIRLGGTIAALAAADPRVARVVLWEPVLDTGEYLRAQLRVNIAAQMVMYRRVVKTREQLVEEIHAGGRVSVNGFVLTRGFYDELAAADPGAALEAFRGPKLLLVSPESRVPETMADTAERVAFPTFWKEPKTYVACPAPLLDRTLRWLASHAHLGGA